MRKELKEIEKIERYLLNDMNHTEKEDFETQIETNPDLKAKVEAQKQVMNAVNRMALKQSAKNAHKSYKLKSLLVKLIVLAVVAATATFTTLKLMNMEESPIQFEKTQESQTIFLPKNDSLSNFSNQMLEQEKYVINTIQDMVIENKDGIVIYIPDNAFDTDSETIELLVQSAINAEDILYAGLSTTSNGNELETGGMFYIDAFDENGRKNLVKDLEVNVPTDEKIEDMQLFAG